MSSVADFIDIPVEIAAPWLGTFAPTVAGGVWNDLNQNPLLEEGSNIMDDLADVQNRDYVQRYQRTLSEARALVEGGNAAQARDLVDGWLTTEFPDAQTVAERYNALENQGRSLQDAGLMASGLMSRGMSNPLKWTAGLSTAFQLVERGMSLSSSERQQENFDLGQEAINLAQGTFQMTAEFGAQVTWWRSLDPATRSLIQNDASGTIGQRMWQRARSAASTLGTAPGEGTTVRGGINNAANFLRRRFGMAERVPFSGTTANMSTPLSQRGGRLWQAANGRLNTTLNRAKGAMSREFTQARGALARRYPQLGTWLDDATQAVEAAAPPPQQPARPRPCAVLAPASAASVATSSLARS